MQACARPKIGAGGGVMPALAALGARALRCADRRPVCAECPATRAAGARV